MTEIVIYPQDKTEIPEGTEEITVEVETTEAATEMVTEVQSTEPVSESVTEMQSTEPISESVTEMQSTEPVSESVTEMQSTEPVTESVTEMQSTEPITETATSAEQDTSKDTDGDLLPDYLEQDFGCEVDNPDTDGDGLPDGYEIFLFGTDPLITDSDSNGIPDSEEDFDNDGLSNVYEHENGLSSMSPDSDIDGLSDMEELNVYGTDPKLPDTDGDGINDADEVKLGLNPALTDSDSNGISDDKERFTQQTELKIVADAGGLPVDKVTVSMECTGCIDANTKISDTMNVDILSSNVAGIIGHPVDITSTAEFDTAVITFHYNPEELGEASEENLKIMWHDEANREYVVLDNTIIDKENHTLSYETTHFSTYLLIDTEKWYSVWEDAPEYIFSDSSYDDVICVVDYTSTEPEDTFTPAKMIVEWFADNLDFSKNGEKDRFAVVVYPYEKEEGYTLTYSKSGIITQVNSVKAAEADENTETDKIYLCKDGVMNQDRLQAGFSWDNYVINAGGLESVHNTGTYMAGIQYNSSLFNYDENGYISRASKYLYTANSTYIQLRDYMYGADRIHAIATVLDGTGNGCYYAGLGAVQTDNAGKQLGDRFKWIRPTEWTELAVDISGLEYINYLHIYGCDGATAFKDIWLEGQFAECKAEEGITAALDAFEKAEEKNNKRTIMFITALDGIVSDELIARANELDVVINVVYMGDMAGSDLSLKNVAEQTGGILYCGATQEEVREQLYDFWRYSDVDAEQDTDGDYIPDIFEQAGLYLYNGDIVETDYKDPDSDDDGICDGVELGLTAKLIQSDMLKIKFPSEKEVDYKLCFDCNSDPSKIDSDGDGYLDCVENDFVSDLKYADEADLTPMVSSVRITMLSGAEEGKYVPVIYEGDEITDGRSGYKRTPEDPNYGGSQMWMYDKSVDLNGLTDEEIKEILVNLSDEEYRKYCYECEGCGVIALLDYYMYLQLYNKDIDTCIQTELVTDEAGNRYIPYDIYMTLFDKMARQAGMNIPDRKNVKDCTSVTGLIGPQLYIDLNKIENLYGETKTEFYNVYYEMLSKNGIDEIIKSQLNNNLPVILGVYNGEEIKVKIFEYDKNIFLGNYEDSKIDYSGHESLEHFMTITGVVEDEQSSKKYFVLSNWGIKYIVDTEQLQQESGIRKFANGVFIIGSEYESIW